MDEDSQPSPSGLGWRLAAALRALLGLVPEAIVLTTIDGRGFHLARTLHFPAACKASLKFRLVVLLRFPTSIGAKMR